MIFLLPLFDLVTKFCYCSLGTGGREKMINVSKKPNQTKKTHPQKHQKNPNTKPKKPTTRTKKQLTPNPGFAPDFQISFIGFIGLGGATQSIGQIHGHDYFTSGIFFFFICFILLQMAKLISRHFFSVSVFHFSVSILKMNRQMRLGLCRLR